MQTTLYVLGPFVLEAGLGLAAIVLALGVVTKIMVPRARLMNQQHDQIETAYAYAEEANEVMCDLVVEMSRNQILEDAMPSRLNSRINDLNRSVLARKQVEA